ncbi:hypothetical protein, partial [Pseudomonas cichorii]
MAAPAGEVKIEKAIRLINEHEHPLFLEGDELCRPYVGTVYIKSHACKFLSIKINWLNLKPI